MSRANRENIAKVQPDGDDKLLLWSIVYGLFALASWTIQLSLPNSYPFLVPISVGCFALHGMSIRKSFADPCLIFAIIMCAYSLLPMISGYVSDEITISFPRSFAFNIYNVADITTIFGLGIVTSALTRRRIGGLNKEKVVRRDEILVYATIAGSAISCLLTLMYIAKYGFVFGGDSGYGQGFLDRRESGAGILVLGGPLAITSLAAGLVVRGKRVLLVAPAVFAILLLTVALGQRKFFLQLLLLTVAAWWRPRRSYQIVLAFVGSSFAFIIFMFLGYLRIYDLPIYRIIDAEEWATFFSVFDQFMDNETGAIYATASAATVGLVDPLPFAGDYIRAWQLAIPHFLQFEPFVPLNDRFSVAFSPEAAAGGMGWGFSFVGEAYLVGGYFGVVVIIVAELSVFRWIYLKGNEGEQTGIWGVASLCSLYFALWVQRNAFAYFVKDFLVYQTAAIGFVVACGGAVKWLLRNQSAGRR